MSTAVLSSFVVIIPSSVGETKEHVPIAKGVTPKTGFRSIDFQKLRGQKPDKSIREFASYSPDHVFDPKELVIISTSDSKGKIKVVHGVISQIFAKSADYQVSTATSDQMAYGTTGLVHTLPPGKIGKIPSTFTDQLIDLEKQKREQRL